MTSSPTALDLPMVSPLPEATQKYFDICQDKLGMVPNVLQNRVCVSKAENKKQYKGEKNDNR